MLKTRLARGFVAAFALAALDAAPQGPARSTLSFFASPVSTGVLVGSAITVPITFRPSGDARFSMLSSASVAGPELDPYATRDFTLDRASCLPADSDTACTVHVRFTPTFPRTQSLSIRLSWCDVTGCSLTDTSMEATGYPSHLSTLYGAVLHRAPDRAGESYWVDRINGALAANVPNADVWRTLADSLFDSEEYRRRGNGDIQYIADLYQAFLQRAPDAAGLAYWSGLLSAGLPRHAVRASFEFSRESGYWVTQDRYSAAASDLLPGFYRGLLARVPDAEGYGHWSSAFAEVSCDPSLALVAADEVSRAFMQSAEYVARDRSDAEFVGDLYNAFLARGADLAGIRHWTEKLTGNELTREAVRQAFLRSPEYFERLQTAAQWGCAFPF